MAARSLVPYMQEEASPTHLRPTESPTPESARTATT